MVKKVVVLGAGMVGSIIAKDLASDPNLEVTAVDRDIKALGLLDKSINKVHVAFSAPIETLSKIVEEHDFVVGALPGKFGFKTLNMIAEAGKSAVDISFMPEDPRSELDEIIYDCGVAPGISNMLAAYMTHGIDVDQIHEIKIMVGGLPYLPKGEWQYKAPFSPEDVLEEYTRPVKIKRHGKITTVEPLTGKETLPFGSHSLEAFLSDGLRSLIDTIPARNMSEKTLRYKGYWKRIKMLRDNGFLSTESVKINPTTEVIPRELTSALLFPQWKYEEGEQDITILHVTGVIGDKLINCEMMDKYTDGIRSMSRTTGFPAAVVARMIINGDINMPGVSPPELIVQDNENHWRYIRNELAQRGIHIVKSVSDLPHYAKIQYEQ
jgi:lysine 6-dehydrogenase